MRPGLAAFGVVVAAAAAAGCGGAGAPKDPLVWQKPPKAILQKTLPSDRVVVAVVRNASSKPVRLEASKIVVREAGGRVLQSQGQYIGAFAHGLYGAFQQPSELPPQELSRLGKVLTLPPGRTQPLTVAWRLKTGSREPATMDYGAGTLVLPRSAR